MDIIKGFEIYSPVQQINLPMFKEHQVEVFIKRDDLIHPYIAGNKWRKLKYVLNDAICKDKRQLVTFGGAWSNHLLATAAASAIFGFKSIGYVRGELVENANLSLCRLFGMELKPVDRTSYKNKQALFQHYHAADPEAYFIDEGGASQEALVGCAEILQELNDTYDHLFCPCGTGTTLAGLQLGVKKFDVSIQLHGIAALAGNFIQEDIAKFIPGATDLIIHNNYHFGGYAKTTLELISFIKEFVAKTGILIEPIYTGKMMYALVDLIKKGTFKPNSKILTLHTGGLTGLLGKLSAFSEA